MYRHSRHPEVLTSRKQGLRIAIFLAPAASGEIVLEPASIRKCFNVVSLLVEIIQIILICSSILYTRACSFSLCTSLESWDFKSEELFSIAFDVLVMYTLKQLLAKGITFGSFQPRL